jgi:methylglutaconyl-CoA hydratase
MRSLRALLAVSGHLTGRVVPSSTAAAASPHSALFVRALQILSQPEPVRLQKLSAPDAGQRFDSSRIAALKIHYHGEIVVSSCRLAPGIVELTLERPEARNAIGKEMLRGLRSAMEKLEADPTANVLLVASSVPKVFCAGADLKVPARPVMCGSALAS